MKDTIKLVTVGFKVPVFIKQQIEEVAKKNSLDTSSYLRSIFYEKHQHIESRSSIPDDLVFTEDVATEVLTLVSKLGKKYSDKSSTEIIIAALKMAKGHEKLFLTEKLNKFF